MRSAGTNAFPETETPPGDLFPRLHPSAAFATSGSCIECHVRIVRYTCICPFLASLVSRGGVIVIPMKQVPIPAPKDQRRG